MKRSRHRVVTITLDGQRLALGHVVTEGQEDDLLRILDETLKPQAEDCTCDTPPQLSDSCRAGGCGMCIGWINGEFLPCVCDCHPRDEQAHLRPEDVPPNAGHLENWLRHWQARALKAEARVAGLHAQATDARRRELDAGTRWRDCDTHRDTILELRTHVGRLNDVMDAYEQLRIGVISLHWNLGQQKDALDVAVVDKHLKKLIDACNRGLSRATEANRAREEGRA